MSLLDIDTEDPAGQRLIQCLVGEVLSEFTFSPAAYLRSPDTWERFVGLSVEATYAGSSLTPVLVALAEGDLALPAMDEFAEWGAALAGAVRLAMLKTLVGGANGCTP